VKLAYVEVKSICIGHDRLKNGSELTGRTPEPCEDRRALTVRSTRQHRTTDYATVVIRLPEISNDLEVVRLL
jgi:hypothetical protein